MGKVSNMIFAIYSHFENVAEIRGLLVFDRSLGSEFCPEDLETLSFPKRYKSKTTLPASPLPKNIFNEKILTPRHPIHQTLVDRQLGSLTYVHSGDWLIKI